MMNTSTMLELADGSVALIDQEDVMRVVPFSWQLPHSGGTRYPVSSHCNERGVCDTIYLHRLIANAGPDDIVIHRNRNTLDNRRENLVVMGRLSLPAYAPVQQPAVEVFAAD